ncbi:radical SAM protein [Streptomyces sp. NBC_01465]|uniref:radical SAM protein n=1 Tax=Streptomyces sp. NBC_01465 TaxID=2903878 RepID=UPI002E33BDCB|nr:radical SAM protein [Streptomyces sp. NBC_01465]
MHLVDLLDARSRPAAALLLTVTRRCPLSCAHCSTSSSMASEQCDAELIERFVGTFTALDRPDFLLLTGGEPLLRPGLVRRLAELAGAVGCRTQVLTGMFFARQDRIPAPVRAAIDAVGHLAVSIDAFHEREVPRAAVLRVLRQLLDEGKDVSVQLTGLGPDDPYLREATDDIRRTLDDRVPVLVGAVRSAGRAAAWLPRAVSRGRHTALPVPCAMASWPVVTFDGTVVACCNQDVVDGLGGRLPDHLRLGHIAEDPWELIRTRHLRRPVLRAVRAFGPQYAAERAGRDCGGYCDTCVQTLAGPEAERAADALLREPFGQVVERQAGRLAAAEGADGFVRRYASERYAELVHLGHR